MDATRILEGLIDLVLDFGKGKRKEHCCKDKERSFLARQGRGKGKRSVPFVRQGLRKCKETIVECPSILGNPFCRWNLGKSWFRKDQPK